ncbi:hypothetical protein [Shinella zoogloeoides]|uniref:hypothetical protein n=1 Tax=Shinella zoogloeoides TaxID=352475 RepID=UPI0028AD9F8B|nr:hypothetical protein [Shinella zoogloeoides]
MNKCPFRVGDTVRRVKGTSTTTRPGFVGKIKSIHPCLLSGFDLWFEGGAVGSYWYDRRDHWELVPTSGEEPKSAEKGTYVVAYIDGADGPLFTETSHSFTYWVDAEANASQCAQAAPGASFGVFKLIGSVQMRPKWSDPHG